MKNILKLLLCIILVLSCKNKSDFSVKQIALTYVKSPLNVPSMVERDKFIFSNAFSKYNLPVVYSELTTGPDQTRRKRWHLEIYNFYMLSALLPLYLQKQMERI